MASSSPSVIKDAKVLMVGTGRISYELLMTLTLSSFLDIHIVSTLLYKSFQMVRNFKLPLLKLLESSNIDLCFAIEDEAAKLLS
ncbi:hypothetical protein JHK85_000871 [Glycine max]|nr:hypothetical protein JHK85_000871 [Glycine max]KAG5088228.1 hypothetical protein JHK86_000840 [Glycine max]